MNALKKPILTFVLLIFAATVPLSGAGAKPKDPGRIDWDACRKMKDANKRGKCCEDKWEQCRRPCQAMEDHQLNPPDGGRPYDPAEIRYCYDKCDIELRRCSSTRQMQGSPLTTRPQAGMTVGARVCCRIKGKRDSWQSPRTCRRNGGQEISGKRCSTTASPAQVKKNRVCCRRGKRARLTTARNCRAQGGRVIKRRYCDRR